MHMPARAGAAEARKVKTGGGEPLGNITGIVDTDQKKRNAARVLAAAMW